jgi:hypothetical protein
MRGVSKHYPSYPLGALLFSQGPSRPGLVSQWVRVGPRPPSHSSDTCTLLSRAENWQMDGGSDKAENQGLSLFGQVRGKGKDHSLQRRYREGLI